MLHGTFANWNVSPDRKYLYLTTGGAEPKVQRLRFADRQIETITSLKDFRRVVGSSGHRNPSMSPPMAPRCSPATSAPRKSMRLVSAGPEDNLSRLLLE